MEDYKDIKDMLTPRRDFTASDELRNRINLALESHTRKRKPMRWIYGIIASCAAAAVLLLIIMPTRVSAKEVLIDALNALLDSDGIEMTVEVRTRPMENFRYINIADDFVEHSISIARSDSTISWRIDKGGRTAAGNNGTIYTWIDRLDIGWKFNNAEPGEVVGEMAILLTPEKILELELQNCADNTVANYNVEKKDDDILLTVYSHPQGDFSNPYMLNASIAESENIRRYVIDADSKHLKSASVSMVKDRKETEVLKITSINYDTPVNRLPAIPSDIHFVKLHALGLTGLNASEAASVFLNALESWDTSILEKAIDGNTLSTIYRDEFEGAAVISVGYAFTSGNEGNTYVPYTLRMPDGEIKSHNLVLQKIHTGGWIVVGGL